MPMSRFFLLYNSEDFEMTIVVEFRYHIGRHVANLQVTNTYEGQSFFCSFSRINDQAASFLISRDKCEYLFKFPLRHSSSLIYRIFIPSSWARH